MAHYAELGVDNVVKRVLFIDNIKCMTNGGIEKEEIGAAYLETHHGGTWIKCSYNTMENNHLQGGTPFRANYPSKGWIYNSANDIFYPPREVDYKGKLMISWVLNTTTGNWTPPIPLPSDADTVSYNWDESLYQSDNTKGWITNN